MVGILLSDKKKCAVKPQECILLSDRSHSEKATYGMIPTLWHSGKGKTIETAKRSVVARSAGVVGRLNR